MSPASTSLQLGIPSTTAAGMPSAKRHTKAKLTMIYEAMVFLLRHVGTQHGCAINLTGIQWGPAHSHEHKTLGPASYLVGEAELLTNRDNLG